ncbi:MAG: CxxxxCH/CxxCH domain-containing protein [Proteobacteria bacterium]|nr:CxxxxCH/CxxCH domain-containing protein [Pseudomonadota bacterium]
MKINSKTWNQYSIRTIFSDQRAFSLKGVALLVALFIFSSCTSPLPDGLPEEISTRGECSICHGSSDNAAPPRSLSGSDLTTDIAVGAHQIHLTGGAIRAALPCESCHTVPATVDQPGHQDPSPAEIIWSALASSNGSTPTWDRTNARCSSVYCHGSSLSGGIVTSPAWTVVDSSQTACGSCHGTPPPPPHETNNQCYTCHSGTVTMSGEINILSSQHINGFIESSDNPHPTGWADATIHGYAFFDAPEGCKTCHGSDLGGGTSGLSCDSCHAGGESWRTDCTYCHGGLDNTSGAPPYGLLGQTSVSIKAVGAHTAHLMESPSHTAWDCTVCHVVPSAWDDAGHMDGVTGAELMFTPPSGTGAVYSSSTATCSSLYCHGNGRTVSGSVLWTSSTNLSCVSCHGYYTNYGSLSGEHSKHLEEAVRCSSCHQTIINSSNIIINKTAHINAVRDVSLSSGVYYPSTRSCSINDCHGSESW